MADTALRLLSGRAVGQTQPVEVHLVITDMALFGVGDPKRSVNEPARIPGHGSVPAPVARSWLREGLDEEADGPVTVWLRRLFTSPDGRDLVAMDSRRRVFTGLLRRMLVLRDDVCTTPWCGAAIVHADHTHPARDDGRTSFGNGSGDCARCNYVKEAPGWHVQVIHTGQSPGLPRQLRYTTPTGHTYHSQAPPLTGWGWQPPGPDAMPCEESASDVKGRSRGGGRARPPWRFRGTRRVSVSRRPRRRPRAPGSPLERALGDLHPVPRC